MTKKKQCIALPYIVAATYLIHSWILSLQVTRSRNDGLDSSHAKVVVVLWAQLLWRQRERGHNLFGQRFGVGEAERKQGNLGDERVVGHHHGHGSEQGLQVVGQFGAAGIAGIHCDEDGAGLLQGDFDALENEPFRLEKHARILLSGLWLKNENFGSQNNQATNQLLYTKKRAF